MPWNWQLPKWPHFIYDPDLIASYERKFLVGSGRSFAYLQTISKEERNQFLVEIMSIEGLESSKIEGEALERESLQSSIMRHFGLQAGPTMRHPKEAGMAELLCSAYDTFDKPLTHEMLWAWHGLLFKDWSKVQEVGRYRTHKEPMQIISGRYSDPVVHFEAPPSSKVYDEMSNFIAWYNASQSSESVLGRASIAHIYFESIHPFEDGNGRIGRVLVEKALSQGVGKPVLLAVSRTLEKHRKRYYAELEKSNKTLDMREWGVFFSEMIVQAQEDSMKLLHFLIQKGKMLASLSGKLNERQEKVLLKMFAEGPEGFVGGMSAEKYIAITKASRATTTRDIADLVEKGALIRTGELKYARYWLNVES